MLEKIKAQQEKVDQWLDRGILLIDEKSGKPYFKHIYKHRLIQWFMDICWPKIMAGMFFCGIGIFAFGPLLIYLSNNYDLNSNEPLLDINKISFLSHGQLNTQTLIIWVVSSAILGALVEFIPVQYFLQAKLDKSRRIIDIFLPMFFILVYLVGFWFVTRHNIFIILVLFLWFLAFFVFFCAIHVWAMYKIVIKIWNWVTGDVDTKSKMRLERMNFISGIIGVILGLLFSHLI